ncbi:hypothetical protein Dfer_1508 [Dyadobacter fermentans DSM 18053]|uniref:Lipocalin-like domain-containing protein n=2 Tax=Dyadobacter fermentans TaxID=94254 RepID=C6VRQ0_DYAFD|nr:hypothetical protein Dfer_1508 [Dyadobacter fermentans DSM 18053]
MIMLFLMLGVVCTSIAQTAAPADFFAGKWEITVVGTPNGDAKLLADLTRTDGKLTGQITNATDPSADKIAITGIDEAADKIIIGFTAQGYDVTLDLSKVDDDNLKGNMMNMFDASAKRVK